MTWYYRSTNIFVYNWYRAARLSSWLELNMMKQVIIVKSRTWCVVLWLLDTIGSVVHQQKAILRLPGWGLHLAVQQPALVSTACPGINSRVRGSKRYVQCVRSIPIDLFRPVLCYQRNAFGLRGLLLSQPIVTFYDHTSESTASSATCHHIHAFNEAPILRSVQHAYRTPNMQPSTFNCS